MHFGHNLRFVKVQFCTKVNKACNSTFFILETSMGVSINAQDNSESDYVKAVKQMCDVVILRSFSPLKMYDFFYQFTDLYRRERKALDVLHSYTKRVINKRKQELLAKEIDRNVIDEFGVKKTRFAFLDLLLQGDDGKQVLSDNEIQEEVDTLLFEVCFSDLGLLSVNSRYCRDMIQQHPQLCLLCIFFLLI